jgi:hypothetical protein
MEYLHRFLYYALGHGILKPSNVLLDEDLVARVGDNDKGIAAKVLRLSISISRTTEKFQSRIDNNEDRHPLFLKLLKF